MRWHAEISRDAGKQIARLPKDVRERITRAIDEFTEKDDSQWSNVKALKGAEWKGRFRKKVGPYRIIFMKDHGRRVVEILRHTFAVQSYLPLTRFSTTRGRFLHPADPPHPNARSH